MKLRIAIVVIGLLSGLAARVAVELYHHYQPAPVPPAASVTPLRLQDRSE